MADKPDANRRTIGERLQPFERQRQMRSALVVRDRVNFIDDDRLDGLQNFAAFLRREQDVQRLRRGHQDVRRALEHEPTVFHQRVAGPHGGADFGHQVSVAAGQLQDFSERLLEIFLNVIAQSFQRRHVQDLRGVGQLSGDGFADQAVDAGEKCGQRLSGAGRRGNQRGSPGEDVRPALFLWLCSCAKARREPLLHDGMGPAQGRRCDCGVHRCTVKCDALVRI